MIKCFWRKLLESSRIDAQGFGLFRIFFYFAILYFYTRFNNVFSAWDASALSGFWTPVSFFKLLPMECTQWFNVESLGLIWRVSMIAAIFGIGFRWVSITAFFIFLWQVGVPLNFGKIHHSNHMVAVVLGILACVGRAGDYSFDAWNDRRRDRFSSYMPEAQWAMQTIWIYMCLVYFNSGFQKMSRVGFTWISNESMATIILTRPTVTELGRWVAGSDWIPGFLAATTVIGQLFAPLALLSNWSRALFGVTLFGMHVGTYALMGAHGAFVPYNLCFLAWLPWSKFVRRP